MELDLGLQRQQVQAWAPTPGGGAPAPGAAGFEHAGPAPQPLEQLMRRPRAWDLPSAQSRHDRARVGPWVGEREGQPGSMAYVR